MNMEIAGRPIGAAQPCYVIAEAGVNHNGDLTLARRLVDVAVEAGADAVKFQTFKSELIASAAAPKANYQKVTTEAAESQLDMLRRLELSAEAHHALVPYCRERGIQFLSTPFEEVSADFLESLGVAAYKLPSGEITNLPFLEHVARKGRPLIVSTGMSTLGEVETALQTIARAGNPPVALLHCVSNYPADPAQTNLRAMLTLRAAFGLPVGYSDHTPGIEVALAAVALGSCIIEKHFTLDRNLPGPDHQASSEPDELKALVRGIRKVESSLGDGRKVPALCEANTAAVGRKSLIAACDLPAGAMLDAKAIVIKRPGNGLPPAARPYLVGRTLKHAVKAGDVLRLDMFN
jgi:N,N'-diacetyllegionaminate synthase